MILTDDNFATIVKAVEYGRAIYDNLAKYIRYQMGMLAAFILSYLGAALFAILGGIPFAALVVLWINFAVQVPIAMALGFDKPSPGLMDRKPRPLSQPVLNRGQWIRIIIIGLLVAVGTLAMEAAYEGTDQALAATMGFVVFGLFNLVAGLASRSETDTVFSRENLNDRRQLSLYGLALILLWVPTRLTFFGLVRLGAEQWLICIGAALALLLATEVIKFFRRRSLPRPAA